MMTAKKPTDLIELSHDWERKLTKCEQEKTELLAALKAQMNSRTTAEMIEAHELARAAIARVDGESKR